MFLKDLLKWVNFSIFLKNGLSLYLGVFETTDYDSEIRLSIWWPIAGHGSPKVGKVSPKTNQFIDIPEKRYKLVSKIESYGSSNVECLNSYSSIGNRILADRTTSHLKALALSTCSSKQDHSWVSPIQTFVLLIKKYLFYEFQKIWRPSKNPCIVCVVIWQFYIYFS